MVFNEVMNSVVFGHVHALAAQARTPRASGGGHHSLADQGGGRSFYASAENLETMGDADLALGFSRSNRLRQSLPLARSPSQNKLRPPGTAKQLTHAEN